MPLRGLGDGSIRLLIAGLQGKVAQNSTMILIDEVEYGLEPHRIMRFISSLGAKEENPPLQAFMTTHSPAVLRELSGNQLFVVRGKPDKHDVRLVGTAKIFAYAGYAVFSTNPLETPTPSSNTQTINGAPGAAPSASSSTAALREPSNLVPQYGATTLPTAQDQGCMRRYFRHHRNQAFALQWL